MTGVERLLSEEEAAAILGTTKRALGDMRRAARRSGDKSRAPISTRVGRYPKYTRKHVLAWLAANSGARTHAR